MQDQAGDAEPAEHHNEEWAKGNNWDVSCLRHETLQNRGLADRDVSAVGWLFYSR